MASYTVQLIQISGDKIDVTLTFESVQFFTLDKIFSKLGLNEKEVQIQLYNEGFTSFQTLQSDKELDLIRNGSILRVIKKMSKKDQKKVFYFRWRIFFFC